MGLMIQESTIFEDNICNVYVMHIYAADSKVLSDQIMLDRAL